MEYSPYFFTFSDVAESQCHGGVFLRGSCHGLIAGHMQISHTVSLTVIVFVLIDPHSSPLRSVVQSDMAAG